MSDEFAIGIDVGATKIAAALVGADCRTIRVLKTFTPQGSSSLIVAELEELIGELLASNELSGARPAIGIGVPAQVDYNNQKILFCTNLPLKETDVVSSLATRFALPVVMDNDANLAALAETRLGAAAGKRHVVCVTLGTGIGGGLVLDGKLYRGWLGTGAEIGHMVLELDGPECACGGRGCFEALAAGPALERNARMALRENPNSLLAELAAGDPENVNGEMVSDAAQKGDATSVALMTHIGRIVGRALASLANLLNPEVFVLGGGMMEAGDLILGPARAVVSECAMEGVLRDLQIVPAALGNDAGYMGAAALAFERAADRSD